MESIARMNEIDNGALSSIDYLMAAAEYMDFVNLMLDFKDCNTYEVEYEEQDD